MASRIVSTVTLRGAVCLTRPSSSGRTFLRFPCKRDHCCKIARLMILPWRASKRRIIAATDPSSFSPLLVSPNASPFFQMTNPIATAISVVMLRRPQLPRHTELSFAIHQIPCSYGIYKSLLFVTRKHQAIFFCEQSYITDDGGHNPR